MTLVLNAGFPHSEIPGSQPAHGSPRLIAVFHVLHRHLAPRHPPYALSSLTQRDAEKLTFFHLLLSAIRLLRCCCLRGSCPAGGLTAQVVLPVSWGDHLVDQTHFYAPRPGTPPGRQGPVAIVLVSCYSVRPSATVSQSCPHGPKLRWR